jgi:mRNA-degrading endonuclease toxin of MazEF toxin-antitoxin module
MRSPSGIRNEARRDLDSGAGPGYAGKPRPAVIMQDDAFAGTASITLCPFTTRFVDAPLIRLPVTPTRQNGLGLAGHVMVDKITTAAKSKLKTRVGRLAEGRHDSCESCRSRVSRPRWTFVGSESRRPNLVGGRVPPTQFIVKQTSVPGVERLGARCPRSWLDQPSRSSEPRIGPAVRDSCGPSQPLARSAQPQDDRCPPMAR